MKINPLHTDSMAWVNYDPEIEKRVSHRGKFEETAQTLCVRNGTLLGIPRALADSLGIDRRTRGFASELKCTMPPRNEEQEKVLDEAHTLLRRGESFVLQATTGFGKTYCASNLIAKVGTTTLVIVTKEDLMQQWRKELKKFLGLTDADIGVAQQNVCDFKDKKVVLGMVHSIAKGKYPQEFIDYFGFVIYDEVHRMGAETFSRTAGMFPAKLRLGLSATVERTDGKTPVFTSHIGPVKVRTAMQSLPLKALMQETGFVSRVQHEPSRMMKLYKAMAASPRRNNLIITALRQAYDKGRKIMIFSELKGAHLEVLYHLAAEFIPETDMGFYVGGMSESRRENSKKCRVIFATYAMTAEATDIPDLDTAILATPRSNILQPVGRILREHPDKAQPVVIDLVDDRVSSITRAFTQSRIAQYESLQGEVLQVGITNTHG